MKFGEELCFTLGIKYPIIQGGMAWVSTAKLAAAVSNAGGLGIIGAGSMPGDLLEKEIRKCHEMTDKPFGANVIIVQNPFLNEQLEAIHRALPPVVAFGAGNPAPYAEALREKGCKIIAVVPTAGLAKRIAKSVDVIVAEGGESGGHIGDIGTMALVPGVVDAVNIPVVAAGGIADGRGMAAALCLGAQGIQMGTRFLCAEECEIHPNYKEKVLNASDSSAVVTGRSIGLPVRALKNPLTKEMEKLEKMCLTGEMTPLQIEEAAVGGLRLAAKDGDLNKGSFMAGQSAGLVADIKTVEEIILQILEETESILKSFCDDEK